MCFVVNLFFNLPMAVEVAQTMEIPDSPVKKKSCRFNEDSKANDKHFSSNVQDPGSSQKAANAHQVSYGGHLC